MLDDGLLKAKEVLRDYYQINPLTLSILSGGLIHLTIQVWFENQCYILQRLHKVLSTQGVLNDYQRVLSFLDQKNYGGPKLMPNVHGDFFTQAFDGIWRLTTFVQGETLEAIETLDQVQVAAKALAQFHEVMSDFPYSFESTHLGHNTRVHYQKLIDALELYRHSQEYEVILPLANVILEKLQLFFLPQQLPQIVVHGDPKFTNLRFQDHQKTAVMLDLDTCNRHTRLVDIGDAIRSWCQQKDPSDPRFSMARYQALIKGYLSSGISLSPLEKEWLPRCGITITLELASRFAKDYLEDDYFAFDANKYSSRRAHNLSRVGSMIQLAQELQNAESEIQAWIGSESFMR